MPRRKGEWKNGQRINGGVEGAGGDNFGGTSTPGVTDRGETGDFGGETDGENGIDTGDGIFIEPGELSGGNPEGGETRNSSNGKTARKTRGPNKKAKVSSTLEGLEGILLSIHTMAAGMLHIQELNLSEDEARKMSKAIARVAALYDIGASEEVLAWVNLAVVLGATYGTRYFAYAMRMKYEAEIEANKKVRSIGG